jgi:hypothetical protein
MRLEIDITRVEIKILFIACIAKPKTKDLNDRSKNFFKKKYSADRTSRRQESGQGMVRGEIKDRGRCNYCIEGCHSYTEVMVISISNWYSLIFVKANNPH